MSGLNDGLTSYPITWVYTHFKGRSSFKAYLGFCGRTGHAFKIAVDLITISIYINLRASDDACEESQRCMYFDCPLNHTDRHRDPTTGMLQSSRRLKDPVNPTLGRDLTLERYGLSSGAAGRLVKEKRGGPLIEISFGDAR